MHIHAYGHSPRWEEHWSRYGPGALHLYTSRGREIFRRVRTLAEPVFVGRSGNGADPPPRWLGKRWASSVLSRIVSRLARKATVRSRATVEFRFTSAWSRQPRPRKYSSASPGLDDVRSTTRSYDTCESRTQRIQAISKTLLGFVHGRQGLPPA